MIETINTSVVNTISFWCHIYVGARRVTTHRMGRIPRRVWRVQYYQKNAKEYIQKGLRELKGRATDAAASVTLTERRYFWASRRFQEPAHKSANQGFPPNQAYSKNLLKLICLLHWTVFQCLASSSPHYAAHLHWKCIGVARNSKHRRSANREKGKIAHLRFLRGGGSESESSAAKRYKAARSIYRK